jgi:hypothetical protein
MVEDMWPSPLAADGVRIAASDPAQGRSSPTREALIVMLQFDHLAPEDDFGTAHQESE